MEDQDLLYDISLLDILSGKIAEAEGRVVDFDETLAGTTGSINELADAVRRLKDACVGEKEKFTANNEGHELSRNGNDRNDEQDCACATEMSLLAKAIDDLNTNIGFLASEEQQQLVPAIEELTRKLADLPLSAQVIVVNQISIETITAPPQGSEKTNVGPDEKKSDEGLWEKMKRDEGEYAYPVVVSSTMGSISQPELAPVFFAAALIAASVVALSDVVEYALKDWEQGSKKDDLKVDSATGELIYFSPPVVDALGIQKPYIGNSIDPPGGYSTPETPIAQNPEMPSVTNIGQEKQLGNDNPVSEVQINTIPELPSNGLSEGHVFTQGGDQYSNSSSGYYATQGTQSFTVTNIPDSTVEQNNRDVAEEWDKYNEGQDFNKNKLNRQPASGFLGNFTLSNNAGEKNITINIYGGLIHNFTIKSDSVKESVPEIKRIVEGAILDALKDAEIQN